MIGVCRVLAGCLMWFCALGAVASAADRSLVGVVFYMAVFWLCQVLRGELLPMEGDR